MMHMSFSELLTAHLSFIRERVLADHEREIRKLNHVLEGQKPKDDRTPAEPKHCNDDQYTCDDSDDSSIHVVQEAGEQNAVSSRRSSSKGSVKNCIENSADSALQSAYPVGFIYDRDGSDSSARVSETGYTHQVKSDVLREVASPKSPGSPKDNPFKSEASAGAFSKHSGTCEFQVASAWRDFGRRHHLRKSQSSRKSFEDPSDVASVGSKDSPSVASMSLSMSSLKDFVLTPSTRSVSNENGLRYRMRYFMVQPSSLKHVCWNFGGLALICYDTVVVPLEIFNPPVTAFSVVMLVFGNLFWTLDIVGNFFTGFLTLDGKVNMRPSSVAARYVKSWLLFDVCLTICNWVALGTMRSFDIRGVEGLDPWRTLTLLRVLRILRLLKAPEMEGFITEHIRSETTRLVASIARLIVLLLVVAHIIACSWYGLGHQIAHQGNSASWVFRLDLANKELWHRYAFSIHWSLSQFTGENIIDLQSVEERTFAILVLIFAFLFSTIFVSSITTLMTRLQIIASKQSNQIAKLRRYLLDNAISTSLAVRVLRNARLELNKHQRRLDEHSVELLQDISEPLKIELHFEVHFSTLEFHPFFKHYNTVNPAGIKKICHQAVSLTWLSAHDVVFTECEMPERAAMFFVVNGELQYKQDTLVEPARLRRGNWACEIVLWSNNVQHMGTLSTVTESSLMGLDAERFQHIVRHFPSSHARDYGKSFVKQINEVVREDVSDVLPLDVERVCEDAFPDMYQSVLMTKRDSLSRRISQEGRMFLRRGSHMIVQPA